MKYNFINPYNFIPFDSSVLTKSEVREENQLLSGSIEYTLQTRTPLIILNTSNDNIFGYKKDIKHKSYEFFSYEDLTMIEGNPDGKKATEPIIPGSEIRGMFRSNYEIITDSCLPFLDSNQILHKRVSGFFNAGLIKKVGDNKYKLIVADDCLLRTNGANNLDTSDQEYDKGNINNKSKYSRKSYVQSELKEGQKIYVTTGKKRRGKTLILSIGLKKEANNVEAYIIKGMPGPDMKGNAQNKHCAHVFIAETSDIEKDVDINRLDETLKMYIQNNENAYKEYASEWKSFKKNGNINDCFPVYYSEVKNNIYLSPASGTMETYKKKIKDIVGEKCACKDRKKLCPACSLFGMLNDSGVGVASRIRFSDMTLKKDKTWGDIFEDKITLQELSTPKLQNMEFYLRRPNENAQFWTYEYWIDKKGTINLYDDKNKLELNGRKFYWHSSKVARPAEEKTERNITVRPLKPNIEFNGKIFFDNISKNELRKLVWLINCGEQSLISEKKHGYKLGHAKPLGYGSVAVAVDSVKIRTVSMADGLVDVDYLDKTAEVISEGENIFKDSPMTSDFLIMTDFDYVADKAVGIDISYPKVDDAPEVFEWFVRNHGKHSQMRKKKDGSTVPERWEYSVKNKGVMPSSRTEMVFREYMKPMSPLLESINSNDLRRDDKDINNRRDTSLHNKKFAYSTGQTYEFMVIGYKKGKDGKPFYLELQGVFDDGIKESVPFYLAKKSNQRDADATSIPKGSMIKLKYAGIINNRPKWEGYR